MVHQRQRLPLGLEAGDDLLGVHAQLDDLERDAAADRLLLLGHVDHAAAAFADLLQQFVAANLVAGLFRRGQFEPYRRLNRRFIQEAFGPVEVTEQLVHLPAQFDIAGTGLVQKRRPLVGGQAQGGLENDFLPLIWLVHVLGLIPRCPHRIVRNLEAQSINSFADVRFPQTARRG